jgi:hypothetical protein
MEGMVEKVVPQLAARGERLDSQRERVCLIAKEDA